MDGKYRIVSQPPIVIPARDLAAMSGISPDELDELVRQQFHAYRATLREDQRRPLERFQIVDMARKVVGVGSVGTQAFIVLLQGRDAHDPLFLQVKEAVASVLEPCVRKSAYRQHGQRVVVGQRMMQAASDIYLGWTRDPADNRHYYWRQLRDMKGSADVESMTPPALTFYAWTCGWTLARAHARSGDPSPSPPAWAKAMSSTDPSPTSPGATPTRTSGTTSSSLTRSGPAVSKRSRASEAADDR